MEKEKNDLKEVTLLFVADESDYNSKIKVIGFRQFKGIPHVAVNYSEIINQIEKLDDDEPFVLFFHLNALKIEEFASTLIGLVEDVNSKYKNLQVYYNTSKKTAEILKTVKDKIPKFDEHLLYENNDITANIKNESIKVQTKKDISIIESVVDAITDQVSFFISHSSEDREIINDFKVMILEKGLQIPSSNIFYTSLRSSGTATSANIPDALYEEIKNRLFFIRYVSKNHNESIVCHNEYGAAWYKNQNDLTKIITLKEKGLRSNELGFLDGMDRLCLEIEKPESLRQFREDYKVYFPNTKDNDWEQILSEFINKWK